MNLLPIDFFGEPVRLIGRTPRFYRCTMTTLFLRLLRSRFRDKLKFNPDGSLDIYLQHDSPRKNKESNWLPADADSFNVALRMYWPKETALNGTWTPPPIKKVD
ncbi:MAG TPA: DUF1214 domain-containing protein [Dongiaceae bacterium]|nr:DUF1214 domain-containing protein [Dongiaceae bacterium]